MIVVQVVQFNLFSKGAIISVLLTAATAMPGASDKKIIESVKTMVKTMEQEQGLAITWYFDLVNRIRRTQQIPNNCSLFVSPVSPDGTALAWSSYPTPYKGEKLPFLTVESLKEGTQPLWVEGRVAVGSSVSSGAAVIAAIGIRLDLRQSRHWELLAIDRRSGVAVHDLTPFVTRFPLGNNVEDIRVSGPGNLVVLGTREQMQVLEIPSGKTMYAGAGASPRLSPDGKRLAFVENDNLMIHSFQNGSTAQLLKGKHVKGLGGWSPDGRFLLAGAWTRPMRLSWEKRQIIVDTATGEYAVIGTLSEGDYGTNFAWVSTNLLER
jgi:WD40-like Beta Propeller Repeat